MAGFKEFFRSECGAVTADWVILTAGVVTLGLAVGLSVGTQTIGLANDIDTSIQTMSPKQY